MFDLKILYAEDNDSVRDAYVLVLKRYFREVYEARDGEEALALYETYKPHILLTDINMPLLDGLELVRIIREKDQTAKIVVLSAYSDQEKLMKAIPLGLSAYLVKPIKGEAFKKTLSDVASSIATAHKQELPSGFVFDIDARRLIQGERELELTSQEFTILKLFTENQRNPVSYEIISIALWNEDEQKNYPKIQNIIKRLRKKAPELIDSVYGFGYQIKA